MLINDEICRVINHGCHTPEIRRECDSEDTRQNKLKPMGWIKHDILKSELGVS